MYEWPESSASTAWRTAFPPFLTAAWRSAQGAPSNSNEALERWLDVGWTALRYVVAILDADCRAAGQERPTSADWLHKQMHRATWGRWNQAAGALARQLHPIREQVACPFLVDALGDPNGPKDLLKAFSSIIATRNQASHGDAGRRLVPPAVAKRLLQELRLPMRTLTMELRHLRAHPIVWLQGVDAGLEGALATLCLTRGFERETATTPLPAGMLGEQAFMVGVRGRLLPLERWVHLHTTTHGELRPALLGDVSRGKQDKGTFDLGEDTIEVALPEETPISLLQSDLQVDSDEAPMPDHIGGYEVQDRLGHGGSGAVYLCREPRTRHPVAVKVLHSELVAHETAITRLRREIEIMRTLEHPGVLKPLETGTDHAVGPYVVMELMEGSLADRLAKKGVATTEAIRITTRLLQAVTAAHQRQIVHRDIKPANVLLRGDEVVLADFGIAHLLDGERITRTMEVVGTRSYSAPEQLEGTVDLRSDLYSLGRVLEEMLGDQPPAPALSAVLRRATARKPADRYVSARAMLEDLADPALLTANGLPFSPQERLGNVTIRSEPEALANNIWRMRASTPSGPVCAIYGHGPQGMYLSARAGSMSREQRGYLDFQGTEQTPWGQLVLLGSEVSTADLSGWLSGTLDVPDLVPDAAVVAGSMALGAGAATAMMGTAAVLAWSGTARKAAAAVVGGATAAAGGVLLGPAALLGTAAAAAASYAAQQSGTPAPAAPRPRTTLDSVQTLFPTGTVAPIPNSKALSIRGPSGFGLVDASIRPAALKSRLERAPEGVQLVLIPGPKGWLGVRRAGERWSICKSVGEMRTALGLPA